MSIEHGSSESVSPVGYVMSFSSLVFVFLAQGQTHVLCARYFSWETASRSVGGGFFTSSLSQTDVDRRSVRLMSYILDLRRRSTGQRTFQNSM